MRRLPILSPFLLILLLLITGLPGCTSSGGLTGSPLSQPENIEVLGDYTHDPSGLSFPGQNGSFSRRNLKRFDSEGYDVSATYDPLNPSVPLLSTVYVYPSPGILSILSPPNVKAAAREVMARQHFDGVKSSILKSHPTAVMVAEREVVLDNDSLTGSGRMATFAYTEVLRGTSQDLLSHVYVFSYLDDRWTLKYRFTHARNMDVSDQVQVLMQSIPAKRRGS